MFDMARWHRIGFVFKREGVKFTKSENFDSYEIDGVSCEVMPEYPDLLAMPILILWLIDAGLID